MTSLTFLPLLGPLSYLLASLVARADRGPRPRAALRALRAAALLGLAGAAATALITALAGPLTSPSSAPPAWASRSASTASPP